ncbi:MAG TPA: hypothetical protein VMW87_09415 [Spirochaetia bacterium]|nr:hypothetical protein [Spirochaetia bacterium]
MSCTLPKVTRDGFRCRIALTALIFAASVLLLSGCATAQSNGSPGGDATRAPNSVPSWVLAPPVGDGRYEYFVGLASDGAGDVAKADERATHSLIGEIVRFLGVRITASTTAEARTTLESFQATVVEQVKQSGSAQVSGFQVADRYVQRQGDKVTVYILGKYERAALLQEQQRLSALFQERIAAVSGPESRGDQLLAVGEEYAAIQKYIEAAVAASSSRIDNADVKFERNITKARAAVSDIQITKLDDNLSATVNEPFSEDFLAKVETTVADVVKPVAHAVLTVSYRELSRNNGRVSIATATVTTNRDGIARFTHPVPALVGSDTLTMRLDLTASVAPLDSAPRRYQPLIGSLLDAIGAKRVSFSYTVVSRARDIPISVVVLDTDIASNPTGENGTASGIQSALSQEGFTIPSIDFDPRKLSGRNDAEIISALRAAGQQKRVAYGTVAIQEFQEGDGYIVKVGGTVKVADLASGRILYSRTMSTLSRGDNAASAISAAFQTLGTNFGKDIARSLP